MRRPARRGSALAALAAGLLFAAASTRAATLPAPVVGDLADDDCAGSGSSMPTVYQRRHPPLVGYAGGEKLLAGGDGHCVLGLPQSDDDRALVLVDGVKVPVYAQTPPAATARVFRSRDGSIEVQLRESGSDSTCVPDDDKCCGTYTYFELAVHQRGRPVATVPVVVYEGG